MKTVAGGFARLMMSYLAVVFVIMLLPVFLLTQEVSAFDGVVNYIFNNKVE